LFSDKSSPSDKANASASPCKSFVKSLASFFFFFFFFIAGQLQSELLRKCLWERSYWRAKTFLRLAVVMWATPQMAARCNIYPSARTIKRIPALQAILPPPETTAAETCRIVPGTFWGSMVLPVAETKCGVPLRAGSRFAGGLLIRVSVILAVAQKKVFPSGSALSLAKAAPRLPIDSSGWRPGAPRSTGAIETGYSLARNCFNECRRNLANFPQACRTYGSAVLTSHFDVNNERQPGSHKTALRCRGPPDRKLTMGSY